MNRHHQQETGSAWPTVLPRHDSSDDRRMPGAGTRTAEVEVTARELLAIINSKSHEQCSPTDGDRHMALPRVIDFLSNRITDEYEILSTAEKTAVDEAIERCRASRDRTEVRCSTGGSATAYVHPNGIAWSFDNPCNMARGVRP